MASTAAIPGVRSPSAGERGGAARSLLSPTGGPPRNARDGGAGTSPRGDALSRTTHDALIEKSIEVESD